MPTQINIKFLLAAALLVAAQTNLNNYFVEAVDAPVSPSTKDHGTTAAAVDSSSDKMRLQRQKSRPSNKRPPSQKQQQQQQQQMKHVPQHTAKSEYDAYMHWCEAVLGIRSVVEIKEIEYVDHLQILYDDNESEISSSPSSSSVIDSSFEWLQQYSFSGSVDDESSTKENVATAATSTKTRELPTKLVRGLAAKHDIAIGDIVISIPLYSLLSVPTTIDHDPVLSRILGPKAREQYGWVDALEYEVPLLVIAVLYHRSLGMESPLSHYIDVLIGTPTNSFPFLWSNQQLRDNADRIGDEVKKLARGIQQDLYEMYDGNKDDSLENDSSAEQSDSMYSYENFRWAFALVTSRHHYLPIQDLDYGTESSDSSSSSSSKSKHDNIAKTMTHNVDVIPPDSTVSEVVPPANQPTDSWVELAKNEEKVVEDGDNNNVGGDDDDILAAPSGFFRHSFLAPLADMINFGPPCVTGAYNPDEHVFELIATCPFKAGQEVTFYYSSECADVIIANYGFLHPLVPPCATIDEIKEKSEDWKNQAFDTEEKLWKARRQVDILKGEILALESQLQSCESGDSVNNNMDQRHEYSMPTSNERNKNAGVEPSIESEMPASQKLRKEGHPSSWRNHHEVGVRGRMNDPSPSHEEFDKQILEELG
ncbi:hypothetical protein ACHAWC_004028 [Mediolabrus comicus]